MKGGFLERGSSRKGGLWPPLPTLEIFFSGNNKELQKSRKKAKKLGKRLDHNIVGKWSLI